MMTAADIRQDVQFEAVIVPQRSLSITGLRILLGVILTSCVISSTVFALVGAWPVGIFAGLELLLAAILFHLHMRAAKASELLLLSTDGLRIVRTSPRGDIRTRHLQAGWITVRLEERPGRVPALLLVGHGPGEKIGHEEVGRELGEHAKRSLAHALADALHRRRNPVFDNPQLR